MAVAEPVEDAAAHGHFEGEVLVGESVGMIEAMEAISPVCVHLEHFGIRHPVEAILVEVIEVSFGSIAGSRDPTEIGKEDGDDVVVCERVVGLGRGTGVGVDVVVSVRSSVVEAGIGGVGSSRSGEAIDGGADGGDDGGLVVGEGVEVSVDRRESRLEICLGDRRSRKVGEVGADEENVDGVVHEGRVRDGRIVVVAKTSAGGEPIEGRFDLVDAIGACVILGKSEGFREMPDAGTRFEVVEFSADQGRDIRSG